MAPNRDRCLVDNNMYFRDSRLDELFQGSLNQGLATNSQQGFENLRFLSLEAQALSGSQDGPSQVF